MSAATEDVKVDDKVVSIIRQRLSGLYLNVLSHEYNGMTSCVIENFAKDATSSTASLNMRRADHLHKLGL
jgi:hypothetical protein